MPQGVQIQPPAFEPGPGWGGKIKKNFKKIILPVIIVAAAAASLIIFFNRDSQEIDLMLPSVETQENQETDQSSPVNSYKFSAQPGEGITHLARKALKEYLDDNSSAGLGLRAEHKIYIEDYLKDLRGEGLLEIGEEIEFSTNEINSAVEMAQGLSDSQLSNLSQYVPLVSGL